MELIDASFYFSYPIYHQLLHITSNCNCGNKHLTQPQICRCDISPCEFVMLIILSNIIIQASNQDFDSNTINVIPVRLWCNWNIIRLVVSAKTQRQALNTFKQLMTVFTISALP